MPAGIPFPAVSTQRSAAAPCHAVCPVEACRNVPSPRYLRPSALPAQCAAKLHSVFRIRARAALAPSQFEPGLKVRSEGEFQSHLQRPTVLGRLCRDERHPQRGLAATGNPLTEFRLEPLSDIERGVARQPRGVLPTAQDCTPLWVEPQAEPSFIDSPRTSWPGV